MPVRTTVLMAVVVALIGAAAPAGAAQTADLFTRPGYPMGPTPVDATFADMNGDGVADIVSAAGTNAVSWGVYVSLGRPGGGFDPFTVTLTNQALESVQVIDLDGDTRQDVIASRVVSEGDVSVAVLAGFGDGTLSEPVSTDLPIAAEVVFGRFGSGGAPLAAVARTEGVEIYRPYTLNGFTKEATLATTPVNELLAADLDGDGRDELVTADNDRVALYRDFAQVATLTAAGITSLHAVDAAGDASLEAIALAWDGTVRVLGPNLGIVRTLYGLPSPAAAAASDFDGNGTKDIVIANQAPTLSVYMATGSPKSVGLSNGAIEVFATDATGDGATDLVALDRTGSILEVVNGDGTGGFTAKRAISYSSSGAWDVDGGDFNGDGKIDVVAAEWEPYAGGQLGRGAHVMIGDGAGGFTRSTRLDLTGHSPSGTSAGDFNGDGLDDVITTGYYGAAAQFLSNGDGTFTPGIPLATCMFSDGVTTGDFNKDGFVDAAYICRSLIFRSHIEISMGSPAGLVHGPQIGIASSSQAFEMETGDVNGDGNLDIAWVAFDVYALDPASCGTDITCMTGRKGRGVSYFLGLGNGLFEPVSRDFSPGDTAVTDVTLADLDGDGRDDFIVPMPYLDTIQVRHGRADGSLGAPVDLVSYEYPLTTYTADLTGDGKQDIIAGHGPYSLSVFPSSASGLGAPRSYATFAPVSEMVLADADRDGKTDVIGGNYVGLETFLNGR